MTRPAFCLSSRFATLCLLLAALLCSAVARADTPIALFKSYAGNLNFVGTQKTMRTAANGTNACQVSTGTLSAALSGIPATAVVVSAHLYWAGSSSTPDYTVTFEGASVSAPATRQFTTPTLGYDYFSGAADVTAQVAAKRNGTYSFGGLTINNGAPYCAVEAVVGGFSLLVIYSLPTETFRVLNLYEGFQYIRTYAPDDIQVTLNLSNFKIPTPLLASATGRIAHITWEGDASLSGGGENLLFNGAQMVDGANPTGNQFNSSSNIGGSDPASYGIDFDAYTLSSPVIAAGQTTATARYQSGQDMVLLNAEVVAVPNVPVADLSMGLSFGGTAARGANITLTHTVTNLGPLTETGPIVVKHTLPTGLTYVSAAGANWACSASGQVVTCTYTGTLALNAVNSALVITAKIGATAPNTMTTTATVTGALFDNYMANNSASYTISFSSARFVFTDVECVPGQAFGAAGQPCKILSLGAQIAGSNAPLYITALDATFKPVVPSPLTPTLYFAFVCHNPSTTGGAFAKFGTVTLNACVPNGGPPTLAAQWKSAPVAFASGKASTIIWNLNYPDVGLVELLLSETASAVLTSTSGQFVVKPYYFKLAAISNGGVNPASTTPATPVNAQIATFAKAGAKFSLRVTAMNSLNAATPNFGKESPAEGVKLVASAAVDADSGAAFADMADDPPATFPAVSGVFPAFSAGSATGVDFVFPEVGVINVLPSVADGDYLNAGDVSGASMNLGRFYADHFDTAVPIIITCAPPHPLACVGTGMHYSKQPIRTGVTAYNAAGAVLRFYQGKFARSPKLAVFTAKGGPTAVAPAVGVLAPSAIADGVMVNGVGFATPTFTFVETAIANDWGAPLDLFMRASDNDNVSSLRAISTDSVEGRTRLVKGRLLVQNAFGSELVALPVTALAQFWTGLNGRWANSSTDNISVVATPADSSVIVFNHSVRVDSLGLLYSQCRKLLSTCTASPTAFPDPGVSLTGSAMLGGVIKFRLKPTNKVGSVDLKLNNPVWLPGVAGKLTFGINKPTPLIYLREVF